MHDVNTTRQSVLMRGNRPVIPPRSNRKKPIHFDFRRYKGRNRIERMFGYLKHQRWISIRDEKTALSFGSFLNLAAIQKMANNTA